MLPRDAEAPLGVRLALMGVLAGLGLFESAKAYAFGRVNGIPLPWTAPLIGNMPWWLLWAALVPLIFSLALRLREWSSRWVTYVAVQSMAAVFLAIVHIVVVGAIYHATSQRQSITLETQILNWLNFSFLLDVFTYGMLVAAYETTTSYRRHREREVHAVALEAEAERLKHQVTEAKLRVLQTELQPHFLFNSFNAVTALMRRGDGGAAVVMLARLGDLLRRTLERGGEPAVPLWEELELLRDYLAIQKMRFDEFLEVTWDIEEETLEATVPTLILQPLVENALEHGSTGAGHCQVRIGSRRAGDRLVVEIVDSGPGPSGNGVAGGLGLRNSRERVDHLFGSSGSIRLDRPPGGGGRVTLMVPFVRSMAHGTDREGAMEEGHVR